MVISEAITQFPEKKPILFQIYMTNKTIHFPGLALICKYNFKLLQQKTNTK